MLLSQEFKKSYYKTLETRVINSPMSPHFQGKFKGRGEGWGDIGQEITRVSKNF